MMMSSLFTPATLDEEVTLRGEVGEPRTLWILAALLLRYKMIKNIFNKNEQQESAGMFALIYQTYKQLVIAEEKIGNGNGSIAFI